MDIYGSFCKLLCFRRKIVEPVDSHPNSTETSGLDPHPIQEGFSLNFDRIRR
jgi:hypothetical protein